MRIKTIYVIVILQSLWCRRRVAGAVKFCFFPNIGDNHLVLEKDSLPVFPMALTWALVCIANQFSPGELRVPLEVNLWAKMLRAVLWNTSLPFCQLSSFPLLSASSLLSLEFSSLHNTTSVIWWNSSWALWNPERWCCESAALNMPANLENSAVATGLEKVSFHSNPKERQCQRMLKLPHNCTHLTC